MSPNPNDFVTQDTANPVLHISLSMSAQISILDLTSSKADGHHTPFHPDSPPGSLSALSSLDNLLSIPSNPESLTVRSQ